MGQPRAVQFQRGFISSPRGKELGPLHFGVEPFKCATLAERQESPRDPPPIYGSVIVLHIDAHLLEHWEATINDYTWSQSYSRSIGVDIRYVLWITERVAGAEFLLAEMGIGES